MPGSDALLTRISRAQILLVVFVTLFWGLNWPVMKMAVMNYPPMTFRLLSVIIGVAAMYIYYKWAKIPLHVPRREWGLVLRLAILNMVVWHIMLMVTLPHLNSGRASVIAYTMPVFSAIWGALLYKQKVSQSQMLFLALGFAGVAFLLSNEFNALAGSPLMALALVGTTSVWALGAQQLRRADTDLNILTIAFWMTVLTGLAILPFSVVLEMEQWAMPSPEVSLAIVFNGIVVFAFCHTAWAVLARELPPVAASISISFIPIIGLMSGAYFLKEQLHWQDGAAIFFIGLAVMGSLRPEKPKKLATPE